MTEEILVFRGELVRYDSSTKTIKCISKDDCFTIEDVDPEQVTYYTTFILIWEKGTLIMEGNELWTNGKQYKIEMNPYTQKQQTKQTQTTNKSLENLSTYEKEAAGIWG